MVAKNTLGALILSDIHGTFKLEFNLGTGFNDKLRQDIWNNKDKYKNLLVKYKFQPCGSFERPRLPVFLGFRDMDDLEVKK
jgi:DNA ligase-1